MNIHMARILRRLGRRPSPARPPKPQLDPADFAALQAAFSRQVGGGVDVKHPDARFAPIETRFVKKPRGTIFAFSGLSGVMGLPVKNFAESLKHFRKDLIFVKDLNQDWYQRGICGVSNSRSEAANFLNANFGGCPRPWTFLGSSGGGFAALHFGLSLQADRIVAYSPQSLVDAKVFEHYRHVSPQIGGFNPDDPENDLLSHPNLGHPKTKVSIYYSDLSGPDYAQAARLFKTSNTQFYPVETHWHNSASALRKAGLLKATFK